MSDVVGASSNAAAIPGVHNVECQRRLNSNGRMKTLWGLPGAKPDPGHIFAFAPGRMQWNAAPIDSQDMARVDQAAHSHLEPLKGGIHVAHRPTSGPLLAENMPRFQGLAYFEVYRAIRHLTIPRKTELEVRSKPPRL